MAVIGTKTAIRF